MTGHDECPDNPRQPVAIPMSSIKVGIAFQPAVWTGFAGYGPSIRREGGF